MRTSIFLEYACVANNTQIHSRSEGEKVNTTTNTLKEAMELPEAKLWKAATDMEVKRLQDLNVYKVVPRTDVPSEQKVIGSKWYYSRSSQTTRQGALGS